ncbi:MAG: TrmH family RNA methyltransferase [Desulfuromonas sp.]|nr:MAG: TrmH family RNA methyltransferase [Desulfuromonas sp.]
MARKPKFKEIETRYRKDRQKNVMAVPGVHDFVIVLDHLKAGFNVAKILRSAQAFGAAEIHLVNIGVFDPAPAKGALRKVPAKFIDTFCGSYADLNGRGYTCYLLSGDGETSLTEIELPQKSAFIFGHEEFGSSFECNDFPEVKTLKIPQYGEM